VVVFSARKCGRVSSTCGGAEDAHWGFGERLLILIDPEQCVVVVCSADVGKNTGRSKLGSLGIWHVGLSGKDHIGQGLYCLAKFGIILCCLRPDFKRLGGEIDLVILGFVEDSRLLVVKVSKRFFVFDRLALEKGFVRANDFLILVEALKSPGSVFSP
jgi:hypothetical protein